MYCEGICAPSGLSCEGGGRRGAGCRKKGHKRNPVPGTGVLNTDSLNCSEKLCCAMNESSSSLLTVLPSIWVPCCSIN